MDWWWLRSSTYTVNYSRSKVHVGIFSDCKRTASRLWGKPKDLEHSLESHQAKAILFLLESAISVSQGNNYITCVSSGDIKLLSPYSGDLGGEMEVGHWSLLLAERFCALRLVERRPSGMGISISTGTDTTIIIIIRTHQHHRMFPGFAKRLPALLSHELISCTVIRSPVGIGLTKSQDYQPPQCEVSLCVCVIKTKSGPETPPRQQKNSHRSSSEYFGLSKSVGLRMDLDILYMTSQQSHVFTGV